MPLLCAATICAGLIYARAEDTPTQAAARAALEQKMSELDVQEASTNAAVTGDNPSSPAAQPSQPAVPTATESQPTAVQPVETAVTTPQAAPPIVVTPSGVAQEPPATPVADTTGQAAAKAALDEKMRQLDAEQAATNGAATPVIATTTPAVTAPVQAPVVATPPAQASANYPGKELGLPPIDVPPPPVSAEKETQLQALLARYMADQVSPEEYQRQRAAILAAP